MERFSVSVSAEELAWIDRTRGVQSRSSFVRGLVVDRQRPVTKTKRDGGMYIDRTGIHLFEGDRPPLTVGGYAVAFEEGDAEWGTTAPPVGGYTVNGQPSDPSGVTRVDASFRRPTCVTEGSDAAYTCPCGWRYAVTIKSPAEWDAFYAKCEGHDCGVIWRADAVTLSEDDGYAHDNGLCDGLGRCRWCDDTSPGARPRGPTPAWGKAIRSM